ncbi:MULTISPECIES: copper chaperone PCu(A)C [Hyphobacterium]|uniref:Copper chaperone PCu(A)C n=1 Tax=Hyphobacterium vulgare TaxID=1736751 RepID=A0ABV6ZX60_9PROT
MRRLILSLPLTLILAACGGSSEEAETHAGMNHDAMPAMDDATPVVAREATSVEIRAAWMRPHPQGRDVTAAYFAANLTEGREDLLLSARIDGAERVELHTHTMDESGVMQMREIGPQILGTEGPLVFTPGGRHLMVFGLPTVVEGDEVTGTLSFQNAGDVAVTFRVMSMPPGQVSEY